MLPTFSDSNLFEGLGIFDEESECDSFAKSCDEDIEEECPSSGYESIDGNK
jgi:hypothetical protein